MARQLFFALALALCGVSAAQQPEALQLAGTIIERTLVKTPEGAREMAKIQMRNGNFIDVDLGPPGGEATLQEGDRVVLTARAGELNGKPVFVAQVITERIPSPTPGR